MRNIHYLTVWLTVAMLAGLPAMATAANQAQSGSSVDCSDYLALYEAPGVHSPNGDRIDVDPGTGFEAYTPDTEGYVLVDFYNEDGENVGYASGDPATGTVPSDAAYGIVCVHPIDAVYFNNLDGDWVYQDGF